MITTKSILPLSLLLATLALLLAYGLEQFWIGAVVALGLGFWGWYGLKKSKWVWNIDLFLAGVVFLVMIGALLRLRPYLLLSAVLSAIVAWDLARFQARMGQALVNEDLLKIEKRHIGILGAALVSGGLFAGITLTFQMQLSFYSTLTLGVILIISMGLIFRNLIN